MSEFQPTNEHPMGQCPDTCLNWDDKPHLEPTVDWIGDCPISHGERDVPYKHPEADYCLCGHPNYAHCPGWPEGGVMNYVLGDPYGGTLDDPQDPS